MTAYDGVRRRMTAYDGVSKFFKLLFLIFHKNGFRQYSGVIQIVSQVSMFSKLTILIPLVFLMMRGLMYGKTFTQLICSQLGSTK